MEVFPKELFVEGPYNEEMSKSKWTRFSLTLINNLPQNQVFKIKSTKPDIIAITPHCGFIRAMDRVEILVMVAGKCIRNKEKFLIQSAATSVPSQVWHSTDAKLVLKNVDASQIFEIKLLMRFLPAIQTSTIQPEKKKLEADSNPALPPVMPATTYTKGNVHSNNLAVNEIYNGFKVDKNNPWKETDSESSELGGALDRNPNESLPLPPFPAVDDNAPFDLIVKTKQLQEEGGETLLGTETKTATEDVTSKIIKELKDRVTALEANRATPADQAGCGEPVPKEDVLEQPPRVGVCCYQKVIWAGLAGILLGLTVAKTV